MKAPDDVINDIVERVSEIVWWNRGLTQIDKEQWFKNGPEIKHKLVRFEEPYVEYVKSPKKMDETFRDYCERLSLNPHIVDAFDSVLFKGAEGGRLYTHQGLAIEELYSKSNNDVIISVPTATGKTESFLLPILDYSAKCRNSRSAKGLKAILIYPLKTLEIDQLNRMVKILDHYNSSMDSPRRIQIAIWDGDTPDKVSSKVKDEREILRGSPLRGLACPRCNEKLLIGHDDILECKNCNIKYYWIKATRSSIKGDSSKIDILITNPESLDYMMISPDLEVRTLIDPNSAMRYIVLDEAHTWRGIGGSHINLLIKRLRNFYQSSKPKVVLASATIGSPLSFAKQILGHDKSISITFEPSIIEAPNQFDFNSVPPCNFRSLCEVILRSQTMEAEDLGSYREYLVPSIKMARKLDIIDAQSNSNLTPFGEKMLSYMEVHTSEDKIEDSLDDAIQNLTNSFEFVDEWQSILHDRLPEVFQVAHLFPSIKSKDSPLLFESSAKLEERIRETDIRITTERATEILSTLLSFGRSANLLVDKYHVFLKPLSDLYWCPADRLLSDGSTCSKCGSSNVLLRFCERCHHPFIIVPKTPEQIEETDDDDPNGLVPIELYQPNSSGKYDIASTCLECGKNLKLLDMKKPWVQYTDFTSYLLSALCREGEVQKAIVFSDGRKTAESISQRVVELDYSLVAHQLYVHTLLNSDKYTAHFPTIMYDVWNKMKSYYVQFMLNSVRTQQSKELIETFYDNTIKRAASLQKMNRLMQYGIISSPTVLRKLDSTIDLIIAQQVLTIYISRWASRTYHGVELDGLTWSALNKTIKNHFRSLDEFSANIIEERLPGVVNTLIEARIMEIVDPNNIRNQIQKGISNLKKLNQEEREKKENEVLEMLRSERRLLEKAIGGERSKDTEIAATLVFPENNDFDICLVEKNAICLQCKSVFPAKDPDIKMCPSCGGQLKYGSRLDGPDACGYIKVDSNEEWPIDHWGKDILGVAFENAKREIPRVVTWVHRAGINADIRGAIEEGLRRSNPEINVVSSTPTLELGVDIGSLDAVVQIGFPPSLTNYVQRSGRTGRVRGKPSYVFTIMRNDHSIDTYYMDKMERYFSNFRPITVPDPADYLPVQAPHVVAECCSFLSRSLARSDYELLYTVPIGGLSSYNANVMKRLSMIFKLATGAPRNGKDYSIEMKQRIEAIFGNLDAYNEIFSPDGPLSIKQRAQEEFGRIIGAPQSQSVDPSSERSFTKKYGTLGNWLSMMGFFTAYRDASGLSIPLIINDLSEKLIEVKTENQIITEAYPGPDNENGAMFTVEGVRFVVARATGGPKRLTTVGICINKKCSFPYRAYSESLENCPLCDESLNKVNVYNIGEIIPKVAKHNIITTPIVSANCSLVENRGDVFRTKIGTLDMMVQLGRIHTVTFTPAFYKSGTKRGGGSIHLSEADIPSEAISPEKLDEDDWDSEFDDHLKVPRGPIGYEDFTEGLCFTIDREEAMKRLNGSRHDLNVAIFSLVQAIRRSVAINAQVETQDFDVYWDINDSSLIIYVLDGRSGGNGVARLLVSDLMSEHSQFAHLLEKTVRCPRKCQGFCDGCLLLERTYEELIRKRLLSRHTLASLLGIEGEYAQD